ncbi:kinesin-like protein KIF28 [Mytilus californianus]|uniref:kinesin-like protein KIF28 n=1 Tax=Mytilus californianus TaxID=6549 RepID=UPI002246DFEB|nr:kinesin-like protein KIF28 [Mytilus californianus]
MSEENVKVAVRVRPFNRRERERNAKCIIDMTGNTTKIEDPSSSDEPKKFTFDFSYWSHDGCKEESNGYYGPDTSHPNGKKFCDQMKVYNELGVGVLENAWEGYNSTLFAYGQTGSGKSWSMVGYGVNKGIVPLYCENIFKQIEEKKAGGEKTEYEVTFSMLEIYNEQIRDLLDSKTRKGGLKCRQHPKQGFYAEGLKIVPVSSYVDIEAKTEEGTRNRTVASTAMNATSSRAHTIVGITFVQKYINAAGEETAKTSIVNLVDLAGSERAESTGATGDRLKEGAAINQSLSCLGNCIAALADNAGGKKTRVPYRDSVLTKLLKNALGGNSKTIMIAALSPADINYDETLSTLRYADRAKQIKTKSSVNEDPTAQLIRELQEENERLKKAIESGNLTIIQGDGEEDDDMSEEEREKIKQELDDEYKSILEKNQKEMEEMKKTFEERLKEQGTGGTDLADIKEKKKTIPHIYNLNMDPQLTGHMFHFLDAPSKSFGAATEGIDITIHGPSISMKHAVFTEADGKFSIEPMEANVRLLVNGKAIGTKTQLSHNDRIIFGTTKYFVYVNPKERDSSKEQHKEITFEMAQEEIAKKSGFDVEGQNKSREDVLLQEDLLEMLPAVEEANAISEELDKKRKFEIMIVSPEARGELSGRTEVMVRMKDLETNHEWVWPRQKFFNRKFVMQEMYNEFQEGDPWELPAEKDPFLDDPNAEFHIGSVKVWLQSIAYMIDTKEQLEVTDFKGNEVGLLNLEVVPCDKSGKKEITEDDDVFIESPDELVGKELNFNVKLLGCKGLPNKFTDIYAKYTFYLDKKVIETKKIPNTINPDWNFTQLHATPKCTPEFIKYVSEGAIMVQIWGKFKPPKEKKKINTKDSMINAGLQKAATHNANTNVKKYDADKMKYMMETAMLRKRQEKMEKKLVWLRKMLDVAAEHKKKKISTNIIKGVYDATTADSADKCIALIPLEKDSDDEGSSKSSSSSDSESSHSSSDSHTKTEGVEKKKKKKKKRKKDKSKLSSPKENSSSPKDDKRKEEKWERKKSSHDTSRQENNRQKIAPKNTASTCVLL